METQTESNNTIEWGDPKWSELNPDEFAESIFNKMQDEPAVLSEEDMDDIERMWEGTRRVRRMALVFLTRPFKEIQEGVETDRDFAKAVAQAYTCLDTEAYEYISNALFDSRRRMMVALACREDMKELLDEADKETLLEADA